MKPSRMRAELNPPPSHRVGWVETGAEVPLPGSSTEPKRSKNSMWTNQREAILRRMWKGGASASIIGDELGISRNAVIGKVHRLKLEPRLPNFKHSRRQLLTGRPQLEQRATQSGGRAARRAWAYDSYDGKPPQRIVSVMTVTVSKSTRKPELTKGELRRLFEEAWRNTATLQATEN